MRWTGKSSCSKMEHGRWLCKKGSNDWLSFGALACDDKMLAGRLGKTR